jgi:hypothetical protein
MNHASMIKHFILSLLFFLAILATKAQHCPFDMSGIIVLNIHTDSDTVLLTGLRISLFDSNDKRVADFWLNPPGTAFKGYIDNENPAQPKLIRFPFAKENYVVVTRNGFKQQHYNIKISYTRPDKEKDLFETLIISATNDDVYSLCGTYNEEVYPGRMLNDRQYTYKPVEVVVKVK